MLSINALGHGQESYYLELAREDYYLNGGEPPGYWLGSGATSLRLTGTVDAAALRATFTGFALDGKPLVQHFKDKDRQPGWDLTFSAPKSVSVVWGLADPDRRRQIQEAHAAAVAAAVGYLEDEFALTRRGKGGRVIEPCGLVAAAFEHGTSREQDANLHTHVLVMNLGVRQDGTTGTILSKPFYESKMAAGAVYRAELGHQLQQRLGLRCEAKKSWFEVAGVPQTALDEFSTRRKQIEAELEAAGWSSAKAAATAALATRQAKVARPRDELFTEWRERGLTAGFGPDQATRLVGRAGPCHDPSALLKKTVPEAVRGLTESKSHFAERDVVRAVAEAVQARGVSAERIRGQVREYLAQSAEVVRLGERGRLPRFTTAELFGIEKRLLAAAERSAGDRSKDMPGWAVAAAAAKFSDLNDEQAAALRHLTQGGGAVRVVSGLAGTGKTKLLNAARDTWERGGMTVVGAALAGKAAAGLQHGAQIPSDTIHRRLLDLDAGRLKLTPKTVVVVDEAGMVGTRLLARLAEHARKADAVLVLAGDHRQLQSIDAGGAFKALGDRVGRAELTHIIRQQEEWAKEAVRRVVAGDAASALKSYADRGLLTVADDRWAAMRELVAAWRRGGAGKPEEHLIFAGTNEEASRLNRLCQAERRALGLVHGPGLVANGSAFQPGDRILFARNNKSVGVKNGSLGTVAGADQALHTLRVKLDGGPEVIVPLETYQHVRLGYAVTTHKGQGVTVDHAYVLAGGPMTDRELAYVQLSRARQGTRVWVDRLSAGEQLGDLAGAMSRSRQQELAHDVAKPAEAKPSITPEVVR